MINSQYIQTLIHLNCTLRLESRKPAYLTAKDLIENQFNGKNDRRTNWSPSNPDSRQLIIDTYSRIPDFSLKRRVVLNRIRTGNGRRGNFLFKWNMKDSPACDQRPFVSNNETYHKVSPDSSFQ